jgi:hypothetical protein
MDAMTTPPQQTRGTSMLVKAAALLALIIAADLWSTHHFGVGVSNPAILAGAIAAGSAGVALLRWLLDSRQQRDINDWLHRASRVALSGKVLVPLYAIGAVAALTVSTVQVVAETPGAADTVTLTPLDTRHPDSVDLANGTARFTLVTSPFGRTVRVAAPGFVPTTFTVYPPGGVTIRLGREMPIAPSVLFRPEKQGLAALRNRGTFRVRLVSGTDSAVVAETSGVESSFVLGRRLPITGVMLDDWRLELECEEALARNATLLAWKRPTVLRLHSRTVSQGDTLRAEVWSLSGRKVADAELVLSTEPLIDFPVPDSTAPDAPVAEACR